MSGPGLNERDAHHAIHQAAFREAEYITRLLRQALRNGDQQQALQVAAVLIEHWQTRTLRHAEAEEQGWYRELLAERPDRQTDVIALTRDHELLRILLAEIQGILAARGIASGVVERFEAMLILNGIHSRTEEYCLLGREISIESPDVSDSIRSAIPDKESPDAPPGGDNQQGALGGDSARARIPLSVARPALYERLSGLLRERGLNVADILVELRADATGRLTLGVNYGHGYTEAGDWPLQDNMTGDSDATAAAEETLLHQIADACESATKAEYHTRMRAPT